MGPSWVSYTTFKEETHSSEPFKEGKGQYSEPIGNQILGGSMRRLIWLPTRALPSATGSFLLDARDVVPMTFLLWASGFIRPT